MGGGDAPATTDAITAGHLGMRMETVMMEMYQ